MARQSSSKPKSSASRRSRPVVRSSEGGADKTAAVDKSAFADRNADRNAESRTSGGHSGRSGGSKRRGMELREYIRAQRVYSRFLGVSTNETDEQVILEACSKIARMIQERAPFNPSDLIARSRSEVALATYRMLDPRRRVSLRQRAQLSRPIHREDRIESHGSRGSLWEKTELTARSVVGGSDRFGSSSLGVESSTDVEESEQDSGFQEVGVWSDPGVITRAICEGAGEGTVVDSNLDAKAWLEERRDVVRALQRPDEGVERVKRQEKSTLSWLLSVFGR